MSKTIIITSLGALGGSAVLALFMFAKRNQALEAENLELRKEITLSSTSQKRDGRLKNDLNYARNQIEVQGLITDKQLRSLEESLAQVKRQRNKFQINASERYAEVKKMKKDLESLQKENQMFKDIIESQTNSLSDLRSQMLQATKQNKQLTTECSTAQRFSTNFEDKIFAVEDILAQAQSERSLKEERIYQLDDELWKIKQEAHNQQALTKRYLTELRVAQEQYLEMKSHLEMSTEEHEDIKREYNKVVHTNNELMDKIAELEESQENTSSEASGMRKKNRELQKESNSWKSKCETLKKQISKLKARNLDNTLEEPEEKAALDELTLTDLYTTADSLTVSWAPLPPSSTINLATNSDTNGSSDNTISYFLQVYEKLKSKHHSRSSNLPSEPPPPSLSSTEQSDENTNNFVSTQAQQEWKTVGECPSTNSKITSNVKLKPDVIYAFRIISSYKSGAYGPSSRAADVRTKTIE